MSPRGAHGELPLRGRSDGKRTVSSTSEFRTVTYDRNSDLPQRSGSFQAMVRAGESVTAYLRTGKGEPVVLLRRTSNGDSIWGLLMGEVSNSFRVIVPERAPEGDDFAQWFRSFLDGLGLGTVRVVADAHFGARCAETGLLDPDWLTMLVVVSNAAEQATVTAAFAAYADAGVATTILTTDGEDPMHIASRTVQQLKVSSPAPG